MKRPLTRSRFAALAALAAAGISTMLAASSAQASASNVTVFASGLNNPRGLAFGKDGFLYLAEGGAGGDQSTAGLCSQVPAPIGPYTGGFTARISKISPQGVRTTVADGLPSSQNSPAGGKFVSGVADVAFVDGQLEALISGAGCSHGLGGTSNGVVRIGPTGSTTQVANLSAFLAANPVANPDPADFEPDGTWFSMAAAGDDLYAVEPNHQELDRINGEGHVTRVVDFSKTFPGNTDWRGPTAIARHRGALYVGTLTPFPIRVGAAQVFKVDPRTGHFSVFADDLTTVVGLAFGRDGALYVLETSVRFGFPAWRQGEIIRIKDGHRTTIETGLELPTAITVGPDGNLYVSADGYGAAPGVGEVLKITI